LRWRRELNLLRKVVSVMLIVLLLISMSAFFNMQLYVKADPLEIIIDTEVGESRFTTYPDRVSPYYWVHVQDHDTFRTRAYASNFWYTLCGAEGTGEPLYFGTWYQSLSQSGVYEVFVWIPNPDPFEYGGRVYTPTQSAIYQIYHKDGMTTRTVNQRSRTGGWYSIGTYTFDTSLYVILNDRTGEPYLSTMIAFDAIKFVQVNIPPTLSNGYVSPSSGDTSTTFSYYVTYSDPEGDVPTTKYVYIDGSAYTMTKISGDYVSGAVFKYSTTLSAGSHNYYFNFDDSHGHAVWLPTSGTYPGPSVTPPPQFGFTVGVSPSSGSVQQGGSVSATVTVTLTSGSPQTVSLTTSGLPPGASATFNPSSGYPTFTSTVTISTSTTTPTETFYITITGSGGGLTRTTTYTLTVTIPNFSISASPTSLTIQQGSSGSSTITITSINGFNQLVQLSVSGAPSGVTATLSPSQVTPPAGGTATSTLTVSVGAIATPGSYTLTVTGTNGTITHNVNIPLEITTLVIFEPKLSIPVYAPIHQQAHRGTILTFIINVTNCGTVNDAIELSVSDTLHWNIQLSETSVTLGPNQSTDVYLNVTTEGYDQNDEITIRGRSQGDNSKTSSCQVKAVTSGEGNGLFNVWLKFSNKDTQDHTLSFDVPDYVKLSSKSILLNPLEQEVLYVVFDPKWYDIHTEPGLNSFSIHVVDLATAKGARIPIKFNEYLVRTTNFDLTKDSYNFANYFYKDDTCYGMAATAIVYFNDPKLLYEKYGKLTTYSLTEKEAIDEILRYQDSWENIKTASFSLNLWPNEEEEYGKLKSEILDWGHPMVLALKIGGKDLHAVVAYKIVEKGDKAYILVYDPDHNYNGLSNILAFRYATYDLTTHELYYYGVKCTFIVREAKEPTLTLIGEGVRWKTRQVERATTWLGQAASWIRSGFHAIFECSVNVTIVDQYGRIISDNGTNQIPNAFVVFGNETKYFYLPSDLSYNFSISAYDVGNFTLMIVRPVANNNAALDLYENVPVKPGTQVTLEVVLYQMNQTMKIDYDGDGVIDESRNTDVSSLFPLPASSVFVYEILVNGQVFLVYIESNSTISDFTFIQMDKEVNFNVTGPNGSFGSCNVTIPKALLYGEPWTVLIDGAPVPATITENATHCSLYFTYTHSTHTIQIIGTWVIAPPPPPTYNLTITTTVGGTTNPAPGTYTYTANASVQVTAIPNADYLFDHWELDTINVGSANPYTVLMDNNHTLKAVFTYSPPPPSLSASISPLSASILVGQSVTFTSTVSGGYTPYTYQWYLNGNPVSGATSNTWTFTPTTSGIYYVYLKVTDAKANTAQSETACIAVATVPVGGYAYSINKYTLLTPIATHIALIAILTTIFITIKRKTKRKH
jgi:hypothetical protein